MAKKIKRIIVFVSHPDDTENEKRIVEKVCKNISSIYEGLNVEIKAVDWRDFSPLITEERPQAQINREIENSRYDIYPDFRT